MFSDTRFGYVCFTATADELIGQYIRHLDHQESLSDSGSVTFWFFVVDATVLLDMHV